jgi:predicted ArsR family transcriptional regulator
LGWERGIAPEQLAVELGIQPTQVRRVIDDLVRKQRTTEYLRQASLAYPKTEADRPATASTGPRGAKEPTS